MFELVYDTYNVLTNTFFPKPLTLEEKLAETHVVEVFFDGLGCMNKTNSIVKKNTYELNVCQSNANQPINPLYRFNQTSSSIEWYNYGHPTCDGVANLDLTWELEKCYNHDGGT